eukprot:snap_masked-scaffold_12-processed-gene-7.37-mRNA-1 protein AED:1.00 eAED:1.00 QI:0/-1/0/0/-1/1/1/0/154
MTETELIILSIFLGLLTISLCCATIFCFVMNHIEEREHIANRSRRQLTLHAMELHRRNSQGWTSGGSQTNVRVSIHIPAGTLFTKASTQPVKNHKNQKQEKNNQRQLNKLRQKPETQLDMDVRHFLQRKTREFYQEQQDSRSASSDDETKGYMK